MEGGIRVTPAGVSGRAVAVRGHRALIVLAVMAAVTTAVPAGAEIHKLTARDGTIHFTNIPADPDYRRTSFTSATMPKAPRMPREDRRHYIREIPHTASRSPGP